LLFGLHEAGYAPNMGVYNAVAHGLTTLSTGGFSPEARSIEAFSAAVQWLIIPFMVAAGTNFALFWHVLQGDPDHLFDDTEFRTYVGVMGVLAAVVAAVLFTGPTLDLGDAVAPIAGHVEPAVRHAVFQVVALVTTTGYASLDFTAWGWNAKALLFAAMFVGGSAGSTGGAVKIVRWLVIVKSLKRELFTTVHPDAVRPVRLAGRALDESAVRGIYAFTGVYFLGFVLGTVFVAMDAARIPETVTTFEAMSAVAATLGNVGPGFGIVGPMGNYEAFTNLSKVVMALLMWVGRLEILPVLVLFTRTYWKA
jgi:trk system potassium uptake protein TrkH